MATSEEIEALRWDTGTTESTLFNNTAQGIFTRAAAKYTEGSDAYYAYARVIVLRGILAAATGQTDYTQNQSSEKKSQAFDHISEMLKKWEKELSAAVVAARRDSMPSTSLPINVRLVNV